VNNSISDGPTSTPSFSLVSAFFAGTLIADNVIAATNAGTTAFYYVFSDITPATFYNDDVFSKQGSAYGSVCTREQA